MKIPRVFLVALGLSALAGAGELSAQRTSAMTEDPGIVTMRYYQCGESQLGAAAAILGGSWRRIAEELIEEGLLLDYRILMRTWGDEWNLVEYYVAEDPEAFRYAYEEIELRHYVTDTSRSQAQRFDTLCPRRKDSQYDVVP